MIISSLEMLDKPNFGGPNQKNNSVNFKMFTGWHLTEEYLVYIILCVHAGYDYTGMSSKYQPECDQECEPSRDDPSLVLNKQDRKLFSIGSDGNCMFIQSKCDFKLSYKVDVCSCEDV